MPEHSLTLTDLLGPVDRDRFFATHWERQPLVVHRERPDYYTGLLTLDDVDRMLFTQELRYPAVRLAKVGATIPPASFTEDIPWGGSAFEGVVRTEALLSEYRAGATIIVDALHRTWQPITLLCKRLEAELNHPTQVNIYLTPANAQGFGQHYDTHDAFILQIAGRKHWRIYQAPFPLPLASQPYRSSEHPTGELIAAVDLQPGDLVYIPRGYVHEAMTSDSQSLHVTLGIVTYTWMDVVAEALARCREDVRFRESVPLGPGPDRAGPAIQARFEELAHALAGVASAEELFRQLDRRFVDSRRPFLEGQIAATDRAGDLSSATIVRRPAHVIFRIAAEAEAVTLRFHGKKLTFPSFVEPALRYIAERSELRISSLPDLLDEDAKLVVVRRLVREGFLWPTSG